VKQLRVAHGDFLFLGFEETRFLRAVPIGRRSSRRRSRPALRVGELLALRWEDVDLVAGGACSAGRAGAIRRARRRAGATREVPLSDDAIATLKEHRHLKGPYVFCEPDGSRLTHALPHGNPRIPE
jgi:integrase